MRAELLKMMLSLLVMVVILVSVYTSQVWFTVHNGPKGPAHPASKDSPNGRARPAAKKVPDSSPLCDGCRDPLIEKVVARYSQTWKKQQGNAEKFRALLRYRCRGFTKAIVTQENTPVGAKIVFDGEKRKPLQVTSNMFRNFAKSNPFSNTTWDTCSVVGNGGILLNGTCGEMIDSAQFVIRCNLPPVEDGFLKDVGNKTDLVTANPSILTEKFGALQERRRPFVESLRRYNDSLMLLPAFSYFQNTQVSLRALYTIQDFESPIRPVFLNPGYLQGLASFWRSQGLRSHRLSSGLMVASLALEVCSNVHLYGFWPFDRHPHLQQPLTNHYYDNRPGKAVHAMPAEFDHLLRLHEQGVLRLHLGECRPSDPAAT